MQFKFRHSSLLYRCFYCDNVITKHFANAVGYHKTYLLCFVVLLFTFISHPFVGVTGTFLLVSACSAQTASEDKEKKTDDPTTRESTPVPLVGRPASNPTVDKSAPTKSGEEAVARPLTGEEKADQNQPRPQPPCAGMTTDIVSPRVQEFLTCDVIQILAKPDSVQSFKVKFEPDTSVPEGKRLGDYPIESEGPKLTGDQLKNLQKLIFEERSYIFGAEKRCKFRPEIGLHFIKEQEAVDVLFSFSCELWLFIYKDKQKQEDFDPVNDELTALRESLFPTGQK
jgi:hypothetical protein